MMRALRTHWPEYLMEGALLGLFMVSAIAFTVLLYHPASPVVAAIPDPFVRRFLTGIAMGLTAVALIYSPWGKQSGAHMNPALTFTFLRLGKVQPWDAAFYVAAQFAGGVAGVVVATALLRLPGGHPAVRYAVTVPGSAGAPAAFLFECIITFILMSMVLRVTNTPRLAKYTGIFAGLLVATYITLESPFSGMSMNPARTLGSALSADTWTSLWVYFTAPPLGMLVAAQVHLWLRGTEQVACAKYHHDNDKRCIHCGANMTINNHSLNQ